MICLVYLIMKTQINKLFIVLLCLSLPIRSIAQTTITYTYDTAGNRTGRSAPGQTLAGVTDNPSGKAIPCSTIVTKLMATPVIDVLLSKEADSIPDRRETALWAVCPFPDEQNRPLLFTKSFSDLPGRQNQPPMLTKRR